MARPCPPQNDIVGQNSSSGSEEARVSQPSPSGAELIRTSSGIGIQDGESSHEPLSHVVWGKIEASSGSSKSQSNSSNSLESAEMDLARKEFGEFISGVSHSELGGIASKRRLEVPSKRHKEASRESRLIPDDTVLIGSSSDSHGEYGRRAHRMTKLDFSNSFSSSSEMDFDEDALLDQVPLDENAVETSIGSIGHDTGRCAPPCAFAHRQKGCVKGVRCEFCHFVHSDKHRVQPCRGRRIRYNAEKQRLMQELEKDPDTFDICNYDLAPSIAGRGIMQTRLVKALENHRERLRMLSSVQNWEEQNLQRGPNMCDSPCLKLKL